MVERDVVGEALRDLHLCTAHRSLRPGDSDLGCFAAQTSTAVRTPCTIVSMEGRLIDGDGIDYEAAERAFRRCLEEDLKLSVFPRRIVDAALGKEVE